MAAQASRKFGTEALQLLAAEGLALPVGLVIMGLLTRTVAPADYGVYTLAATIVGLVEWGMLAFFSRAVMALASEASDWRPLGVTALRLHLMIGAGLALGLWLGRGVLATALAEARLPAYLGLLALDVPLFTAAQACGSLLVARGRLRERVACLFARHALRVGVGVALIILSKSALGAVVAACAASAAELLFGLAFTGIRPWQPTDFSPKRLLGFALPTAFATFALRLVERLDVFCLKLLGASTIAVGGYAAAQGLAMALPMALLPLMGVLLATVRRAWLDGDAPEVRRLVAAVARQIPRLLPVAALGAGAASEIMTLIYGAAYAPVAASFRLLLLAGIAQALFGVASTLLVALGALRALVVAVCCMVLLAGAGHALVTARWLEVGAASVTAGAIGLTGLACLAHVCRITGARLDLIASGRCGLVAVGVFLAARAWPAAGFFLAVKLLTLSVTAVAALAVLREFRAEDRKTLLAALRLRAPARDAA